MPEFSVFIPVYEKEQPQYLSEAMHSIWSAQTLRPNEIVLVEDGPLTEALDKEVEKWKEQIEREGGTLVVVSLEKQPGVGAALGVGVRVCTHDIIARMDSDDISHPERFQKQLDFMARNPEVDIVGSVITEFKDEPNVPIATRRVPLHHEQIVSFARTRNPLNGMTIMAKKEAILRSGNYRSMPRAEDYDLSVRMILNGAITANIAEPLVNARSGERMIKKRVGIMYMIDEYKALRTFHEIGFLSLPELLRSLLIRMPVRILPTPILKLVYRLIRRVRA